MRRLFSEPPGEPTLSVCSLFLNSKNRIFSSGCGLKKGKKNGGPFFKTDTTCPKPGFNLEKLGIFKWNQV